MAESAADARPAHARRISSDSIPAEGFTPGTMLAGRYRVVGLLGRGGMGEVYRADDLKLGQPVALKFLPKALAADPVRRERFFAEVRITRQLAHPNICRVYDIAEFDGQHFLSMEYIDGEDLASLIQRIGYLPNEKALEITRQLVAGLAAAHERGVLHRDLKPSNIMLDGRGRVRITDFGIAIAAEEGETGGTAILGTPAYMAPEQFAGKGASTRSDIYALGMILYEIYGGKRAFTSTTIGELRQEKEGQTPKAPSEIRRDVDPVVDRLIMRCLERDSRARPASAAQLALGLPGGDPLAAALAAGETPSPELVAASGLREGLGPALAIGILLCSVVGWFAGIILEEQHLKRASIPPAKSPAVLMEQAREFLRRAGHVNRYPHSAYGFRVDPDRAAYVRQSNQETNSVGEPDYFRAVHFWYRESPEFLKSSMINGVAFDNPPLQAPGEIMVLLDIEGRLVSLRKISERNESTNGAAGATADWMLPFSEAQLDNSQWTPVDPQTTPLVYADERAAWKGSLPELPQVPVRIEAATFLGKLVNFEIVGPWTGMAIDTGPNDPTQRLLRGGVIMLSAAVFFGSLFIVRRNLRLGRGDRRGATLLALLNLGSMAVFWALRAHHSFNPVDEFDLFLRFAAVALLYSAVFWAFYIALEPYVRRRWPAMLVSWSRLLSGEWRDPLVGRDALIGCGVAALAVFLERLMESGIGIINTASRLQNAMGVGWFTSRVIEIVGTGTLLALGMLCLVSFLRVLLRSDKLVALVVILVPALLSILFVDPQRNPRIGLLSYFVLMALPTFVLVRFGFLALVVWWVFDDLFLRFPLTLQSSIWYSTATYGVLTIAVVFAFFACRISLGGRPILDA
jgi:serine/threonine-protein kinase